MTSWTKVPSDPGTTYDGPPSDPGTSYDGPPSDPSTSYDTSAGQGSTDEWDWVHKQKAGRYPIRCLTATVNLPITNLRAGKSGLSIRDLRDNRTDWS